jgi:hypothetical protein
VLDPAYTEIVTKPGYRWHLQNDVLLRGEVLVQHRDPPHTWFAGSRYYRGLSIVQSIEARPILIWRWPAWHRGATYFPFHKGRIEAAPGALVSVMTPVVDADGKHGHWEKQLRPTVYNAMPHGEHYSGHHETGATVGVNPLALAFPWPQLGDTYVGGVPTGVPLRFDSHPPAIPPEPAKVRELRLRQEAAVRLAQEGRQRPSYDPGPSLPELERKALERVPRPAARPVPRAWAAEGFQLTDAC